MDWQIPLKNKNGDVVCYSKVDKDDYDKYIIGFWHLTRGYASGKFGKLKGLLHRFIMDAKKGDHIIDHINHDALDNRKANLRFTTRKQNSQNKTKTKDATSKYFGVSKVSKTKDTWLCSLTDNNGKHVTHSFKTETHAAYCYDRLAKIHYGIDAQINCIDKPDNFEIPVKKENPKYKGIYPTKGGRFNVIVWNKKSYNLGTFDTEEEALEVRNKKIQEFERIKEIEEIKEIKRNEEGQAVIETFNKNKEIVSECIVDDDKYYGLNKYKNSYEQYNSLYS